MRDSDGAFMAVVFATIIGIVLIVSLVTGVDGNGFSCPAGSQTIWETGKNEIEGCILPGGGWLDDPDD